MAGAQSLSDEWLMPQGLIGKGVARGGRGCFVDHLLCVRHCARCLADVASINLREVEPLSLGHKRVGNWRTQPVWNPL